MEKITDGSSLKDHFLIAMPGLSGSLFANSVTYLCEHNRHGAMGLVINHPLDLTFNDVFAHLNITRQNTSHPASIMAGGPVEMNRGFVLHRGNQQQWDASISIAENIILTTSLDIVTAIAQDEGPKDYLITLGYAGWGAGQLEEELANNAWLTMPADPDILFHTPMEQRLHAATLALGIDWDLISPHAGHA